MKAIRILGLLVLVVMLVGLVLGTACTGAQGEQGPQGIPGEPGPNMIVAMGTIGEDGTILEGYNVTSCVFDNVTYVYTLTLTGITYTRLNYVTVVTIIDAVYGTETAACSDDGAGKLTITIQDADFYYQLPFSFIVLAVP